MARIVLLALAAGSLPGLAPEALLGAVPGPLSSAGSPATGPRVSSGPFAPVPWGEKGHLISGRAAAVDLPVELPAFFRDAAAQLRYLNPEPDRWRDDDLREMNEAFRYDHYVDMENLTPEALQARDRFEYLEALFDSDLEVPVRDGGLLHLRIVELYERILTGFRQWREADGLAERRFIEERIINDAGILGHYVTDGAQPHHTTIHFNGWARNVPNPEGYTTSRDIHWRFESAFVNSHVEYEDVAVVVARDAHPRALTDVKSDVWRFLEDSNGQVERLYQLERDFGFDPDAEEVHPETRDFVVARMVAGVEMLRALWWTAWMESEG